MESGLTPGFSRASSKESKKLLVVPDRSLGGFDIRNIHIIEKYRVILFVVSGSCYLVPQIMSLYW